MIASPPSAAWRAPRVRATEYTPAVLRFPSGDCATGSLEVISSTGGLLRVSKPLIRGTRIKVMFLTQSGPVLGTAEMLAPVSWTEQPFRFVALAHSDQRRLRAITGYAVEPDTPKPGPVSRPVASVPVPAPVKIDHGVDSEHQWIDKYRDAVSRNQAPRPLLKRMLAAIKPGTE